MHGFDAIDASELFAQREVMGRAALYALREREILLDIFEMIAGARITLSYIRPGGLFQDVPPAFKDRVQQVVDYFPKRFDEYEKMLTDNPIWKGRMIGVGPLTVDECLALGVTGPLPAALKPCSAFSTLRSSTARPAFR